MNWKNIELYDYSGKESDLLMRVQKKSGTVYYIIGYVDADGDIFTKGDWGDEGGYLGRCSTLHRYGVESVHYVNPLEIKL